jgi:hypothetical protein
MISLGNTGGGGGGVIEEVLIIAVVGELSSSSSRVTAVTAELGLRERGMYALLESTSFTPAQVTVAQSKTTRRKPTLGRFSE